MTLEQLRRLLAPELLVVDVTDAAIVALRKALRAEHPTVDEFPSAQGSDLLRQAALVLRSAARLRRALKHYRVTVDRTLRAPPSDDIPF